MKTAIAVRSLSFRYPDGTSALTDVTFAVDTGECVGLLGPNGSGKSTLLRHLNGILPERLSAKESAVRIEGIAVTSANVARVRVRTGLLFQDPDDQLFCGTVREDVAFGPQQLGLTPAEIEQRVEEALDQVGLAHLAHRPPHHLSTGEKRRACLAGVLACAPGILVLDEPTSGLDPVASLNVEDAIIELRRAGKCVLLSTHMMYQAEELCDRLGVIGKGQMLAEGTIEEILAQTGQPTLRKAFFHLVGHAPGAREDARAAT